MLCLEAPGFVSFLTFRWEVGTVGAFPVCLGCCMAVRVCPAPVLTPGTHRLQTPQQGLLFSRKETWIHSCSPKCKHIATPSPQTHPTQALVLVSSFLLPPGWWGAHLCSPHTAPSHAAILPWPGGFGGSGLVLQQRDILGLLAGGGLSCSQRLVSLREAPAAAYQNAECLVPLAWEAPLSVEPQKRACPCGRMPLLSSGGSGSLISVWKPGLRGDTGRNPRVAPGIPASPFCQLRQLRGFPCKGGCPGPATPPLIFPSGLL